MADASAPGAPAQGGTAQNDRAKNGLAELRQLLLSPEQQQLDELRARLDAMELGVEHVSHVLPEAIARRGHPDRPLTTALLPSLEDAIKIMGKTQIGKTISDEDVTLLVKFLKTLTGEYNGVPLSQYSQSTSPVTQPEEAGNRDNKHTAIRINREKS